jgi:hypothetical protein
MRNKWEIYRDITHNQYALEQLSKQRAFVSLNGFLRGVDMRLDVTEHAKERLTLAIKRLEDELKEAQNDAQ